MEGLVLLGAANPSAPPDDDKFLGVPKWLALSLGAPLAVFGILWAKGRFDAWLMRDYYATERAEEKATQARREARAEAEKAATARNKELSWNGKPEDAPYFMRLEEGVKALGGEKQDRKLAGSWEFEADTLLSRASFVTDPDARRRLLYNYARALGERSKSDSRLWDAKLFTNASTAWKWAKAQEVIHREPVPRPRWFGEEIASDDSAFISEYLRDAFRRR